MCTDEELKNTGIALNKQEKITDQELKDAVKVLNALSKALGTINYDRYGLMTMDIRRHIMAFEGFIDARERYKKGY